MIKAICYLLAIALAVSSQSTSFIQPPSPCPNVFQYVAPTSNEIPGPGTEKWYGVITLTTDVTLHALWLNVILDRKADILGNWVGEVTTEDNLNFKIENTKMKLVPDTPIAVRFFIQYKEKTMVPKLIAILFNGREICNIDTSSSSQSGLNTTSNSNIYDINKTNTDSTTLRPETIVQTKNVYQGTTSIPKWTVKIQTQKEVAQIGSRIEDREIGIYAKNKTQSDIKSTSGTKHQQITTNKNIERLFSRGPSEVGNERFQDTTPSNVQIVYGRPINPNLQTWTEISETVVNNEQTATTESTYNKPQVWNPTVPGEDQKVGFQQPEYTQTRSDDNPVAITGSDGKGYHQPLPINMNQNDREPLLIVDSIRTTSPRSYLWSETKSETAAGSTNSRYNEGDNRGNDQNTQTPNDYQESLNRRPSDDQGKISLSVDSGARVTQDGSRDIFFTGGIPTLFIPDIRESSCGKVTKEPPRYLPQGSTTSEGQWPWQAAIYQQQTVDLKYICGATLVSDRHVITAAHCVAKKNSRQAVSHKTLTVYLGKFNLRTSTEGVQITFVNKIVIYPNYNPTTFNRDLAILELREAVSYTDWVRPACLWPETQTSLRYIVGQKGSVVGWGSEVTGVSKEELNLLEMPVVSQETCISSFMEFYEKFTSDYTYCAGYNDNNSVCKGDSGGGMVFKRGNTWYLRGLVSVSVARSNVYRCDPTHYVVFTDIAKYLPWIEEIIT